MVSRELTSEDPKRSHGVIPDSSANTQMTYLAKITVKTFRRLTAGKGSVWLEAEASYYLFPKREY